MGSPESIWGRAGLHTGDKLVSVNGASARTWLELRGLLLKARRGDTMRIEVSRPSGPFKVAVPVLGYDRPVVRIETDPSASEKAMRLREAWMTGR